MNSVHHLVEFRTSVIHGTGGFATAAIPAGTQIIQYLGERIDKRESLERCTQGNPNIFCLDETWDLDGSVPWNPARFINHCCTPNCDAEAIDDEIWIVANRAIAPGEELTFNYNYDLEDYREHPCQCGSPQCVGFIVAEELFAQVRGQAATPTVTSM